MEFGFTSKEFRMTRALFPGSFDPFTLGHKDIVERALAIADEVVVAIGVNADKKGLFTVQERKQRIEQAFKDEPRVRVVSYSGLTTDFAQAAHAQFIVRGVRSLTDFEYEKNIAQINRQLTGIETVLLFADERFAGLSSSIVRELISYGKDISRFIP